MEIISEDYGRLCREKNELLKQEMKRVKDFIKEFKEKYGFEIPYYIAEEFVENGLVENKIALTNLAKMNDRLSEIDAKTLKEIIKKGEL